MRNLLWLPLWGCLLLINLSAATIEYQFTALPTPGQYRYTYTFEGTFSQNQQIDIQFNPAIYASLFNWQAGPDWDLLVFQPNQPMGATGDYLALALVNNPSLVGPFSVDFTFVGQPQNGGPQTFSIDQFDSNGNYVGNVTTGETVRDTYESVPEPRGLALSGVALLALFGCWAARRRVGAAV